MQCIRPVADALQVMVDADVIFVELVSAFGQYRIGVESGIYWDRLGRARKSWFRRNAVEHHERHLHLAPGCGFAVCVLLIDGRVLLPVACAESLRQRLAGAWTMAACAWAGTSHDATAASADARIGETMPCRRSVDDDGWYVRAVRSCILSFVDSGRPIERSASAAASTRR